MSVEDRLREQVRAKISDAYYDARNAGETMETAADNAADAVARLFEQARREERERIAHAEAVAAVWIVAFLDDHDSGALRAAAHPLSLVCSALAGETEPARLGVPDDACWEAALEAAHRGGDPIEAIRVLGRR